LRYQQQKRRQGVSLPFCWYNEIDEFIKRWHL